MTGLCSGSSPAGVATSAPPPVQMDQRSALLEFVDRVEKLDSSGFDDANADFAVGSPAQFHFAEAALAAKRIPMPGRVLDVRRRHESPQPLQGRRPM